MFDFKYAWRLNALNEIWLCYSNPLKILNGLK